MTITREQFHEAMEQIAPLAHAESWDNVGELVRGRTDHIDRILLTIDLTLPVLEEAIDAEADTVLAYHPPIFEPLKRLDGVTPTSSIVLGTIRAGIRVYSPHTALDAAQGGVNDWLADSLGAGDRRALAGGISADGPQMCKIITFCPAGDAETIRDALAAVGAGTMGDYQRCSFELMGTGTFHGNDEASPAVGRKNRLERVPEVRLEMICPANALPGAIRALKTFHPYEEPPVDIYNLAPVPLRETGGGRRVVLDRSVSMRTLVDRIRTRTGVKRIQVARSIDRPQKHRVVGLCAGAGGSMLDTAIDQGCTVFVTGEMRHHDVLKAQASGCSVILAGHTNTERGYLPVLGRRLTRLFGEQAPQIMISRRDRDPLRTT